MLAYLLAVLAACANATSSVLQRKANRQVPRTQNLSPRLIWSLAHEPVWFGGVLAVFAGFLLQATALGNGQLSLVEPILVLELPATLILAAWVFRTRPGNPAIALVRAAAFTARLGACQLTGISNRARGRNSAGPVRPWTRSAETLRTRWLVFWE